MVQFRLRNRIGGSSGGGGDSLTSGAGSTVGTNFTFAPVLRDREVYRTTLVPVGQDGIDLQTEVAIPASPTATSWTVTGTDLNYFDLTAGVLTLKSSTRASITKPATLSVTVTATNSYGTSQPYVLSVKIPADADCRFADYGSGVDSQNGTTPALAWKHVPGTTPFTGTNVTLTGGKVLFLRGGVFHRYILGASTGGTTYLAHGGSSGNPMVYCLNGWNGRAYIDGSDVVTGWTSVTQGEVGGNPNYTNIEKLDLTAGSNGGAMNSINQLFCGSVMCMAAQTPTPDNLYNNEVTNDPTGAGGMWQATNTTSTGTTPRMSQSGTTVTIVDPRLTTALGSNQPVYVNLWLDGNNMGRATVTGWNSGTNTLTATLSSGTIRVGTSAFSVTHHPAQIVESGQFALVGTTLYAWRPNTDTTSVSRRGRGMSQSTSYTIVEGGQWQRFCADTGGNGGYAISHGGSGTTMTNSIIRDLIITQCNADGGDGVIHGTNISGNSLTNAIIERVAIVGFNPRASGIRLATPTLGYVGGTAAQVRGNAWGKIRWNYCAPGAIGRTFILSTTGDGYHYYENCCRDLYTVHGNGISLYADATTAYNRNNVVENNYFDNVIRCYTESMDTTLFNSSRNNLITRNVFLGNTDGAVFFAYDGELDTIVEGNLIMGATGWVYTWAAGIDAGLGIIFRNNVVAGISYDAANATKYNVTNNLLMINVVPPNVDANKVSTGNTVVTGAPIGVWDKVLTTQMNSTLGSGPLGIFWNVA